MAMNEINTTMPPHLVLLNEFVVGQVPSVAPTAEGGNLTHVHTEKDFRILDVDVLPWRPNAPKQDLVVPPTNDLQACLAKQNTP